MQVSRKTLRCLKFIKFEILSVVREPNNIRHIEYVGEMTDGR